MRAPGDLEVGEAHHFTMRENDPRSPVCPRHLRRICGTCTHFAGKLRGAAPAACGYFHTTVTAGKPAAKCARWARK